MGKWVEHSENPLDSLTLALLPLSLLLRLDMKANRPVCPYSSISRAKPAGCSERYIKIRVISLVDLSEVTHFLSKYFQRWIGTNRSPNGVRTTRMPGGTSSSLMTRL